MKTKLVYKTYAIRGDSANGTVVMEHRQKKGDFIVVINWPQRGKAIEPTVVFENHKAAVDMVKKNLGLIEIARNVGGAA